MGAGRGMGTYVGPPFSIEVLLGPADEWLGSVCSSGGLACVDSRRQYGKARQQSGRSHRGRSHEGGSGNRGSRDVGRG